MFSRAYRTPASSLSGSVLGKLEELPQKPLGQEPPLLRSPVQSSRGRPSSASAPPRVGLSLHIISHSTDSISSDQSPSKDPKDLDAVEEPLPSPDPVIIHSQVPLTPDGSPMTGPPPYWPPGSPEAPPSGHPASLPEDPDRTGSCTVPRSASAPPAQLVSGSLDSAPPECPGAAEQQVLVSEVLQNRTADHL